MTKFEDRTAAEALPGTAWLDSARGRGILGRLSDELVAALIRGAQRVEYPAGSVGLRYDETPKAAIVLNGTLRSFISYPDGSQATTRYLRAGDLTGVFAPRRPVLARGVQAIAQSELLFVAAERIRELALAEPSFAWALIEELTTVLNLTQRAMYLRAFATVRQRVVCAIVDRATASGALRVGQTVVGTQQDLAIAVGSVREVVATTLGSLKHEGLVDLRRGGLVILDPDRLVKEADAVVGGVG